MPEYLVIVDSPAALGGLRRRFRVDASAPPRLAVVVADEAQEAGLRGAPGVESVLTGPEAEIPHSLVGFERTFAEAWKARQRSGAKQRRGDGLAWDAAGFLPPDKPANR